MGNRKGLSHRALGILRELGTGRGCFYTEHPQGPLGPSRALVALVALAAENPGLEWGNYATGDRAASLRAYRGDARTCQAGLRAVRDAVRSLRFLPITDADVLAACAGGGRVECRARADGGFAAYYLAGQYYPTEYRHAVARAIDRAAGIAAARVARESQGAAESQGARA